LESSDLAGELREIADQLRFLEKKLTSTATKLSGRQCLLDGQPIDTKILSEFKSSLDRARHSVWALLEALAGYTPHGIAESLQEFRMQRASELLHALRPQVEAARPPDTPAARSFFEEVQIASELTLRRDLRERR
jgi:uncharacterized protein (DUF983 family)